MQLQDFTRDSALTGYLPLPRSAVGLDLTGTALLLYALLLDRATLSQKSGYADEAGRVFVYYPVKALGAAMGRGPTAVKRGLRELESAGLIRRAAAGGRCRRIFLRLPADAARTGPGRWTDPRRAAKRTPSNRRESNPFTHRIYQSAEGESL